MTEGTLELKIKEWFEGNLDIKDALKNEKTIFQKIAYIAMHNQAENRINLSLEQTLELIHSDNRLFLHMIPDDFYKIYYPDEKQHIVIDTNFVNLMARHEVECLYAKNEEIPKILVDCVDIDKFTSKIVERQGVPDFRCHNLYLYVKPKDFK